MTDIQYLSPRTLDEAISAFAAAGSAARIMAGGTDLLVQMRSGAVRPGLIVDIKKIAEMTAIEETAEGGFRVRAAVPRAVRAEHRNGHRRGRRRRQPDAERWRVHRSPGRAWRGGADRAAGRGGGEGADRQQTRRCGAECRG